MNNGRAKALKKKLADEMYSDEKTGETNKEFKKLVYRASQFRSIYRRRKKNDLLKQQQQHPKYKQSKRVIRFDNNRKTTGTSHSL